MIELVFDPPAAYKGPEKIFSGNHTYSMDVKDRRVNNHLAADVPGKFQFYRSKNLLVGLLLALQAIPCRVDVRGWVGERKWELRGKIFFLREQDRLLVEEAVSVAEDYAASMAAKCPDYKLELTYKQEFKLQPAK